MGPSGSLEQAPCSGLLLPQERTLRRVAGDIARARALYRKALNLGVHLAYERLEALR